MGILGYSMTICSFINASNWVATPGGPGLYQVEAIWRGEKPGQALADRTQRTSSLSSFLV